VVGRKAERKASWARRYCGFLVRPLRCMYIGGNCEHAH
jgi:hypothetical protein